MYERFLTTWLRHEVAEESVYELLKSIQILFQWYKYNDIKWNSSQHTNVVIMSIWLSKHPYIKKDLVRARAFQQHCWKYWAVYPSLVIADGCGEVYIFIVSSSIFTASVLG